MKENIFDQNYLKAVKIAMILNFLMFCLEIGFGFYSNSLALISDATDFLGDSLNYAIAIYVLSKPKKLQSIAALIKASFMMSFGIYVLANGVYKAISITEIPHANTMISISILSLLINLFVSLMLFKFKEGNSNQKSVWLCSRNDVINNFMTIIAGFIVLKTSSKWPDLIVAVVISFLSIISAIIILKEVKKEMQLEKTYEY